MTIQAKKKEGKWWDKLTSGPKPINVKVDWNTWKDEDEADEAGPGDEDFNFNDANGMGGDDRSYRPRR